MVAMTEKSKSNLGTNSAQASMKVPLHPHAAPHGAVNHRVPDQNCSNVSRFGTSQLLPLRHYYLPGLLALIIVIRVISEIAVRFSIGQ